jgi:hypothetical protein
MVPVGTWALAIAAERVRQTSARNTFTRIHHPFDAVFSRRTSKHRIGTATIGDSRLIPVWDQVVINDDE